MPFTTVCPNCDARLTAPDTVRGKKVKCKKCDEPFVAKPAAVPEDDDEPPARPARSRRDDDEDDAPPRKPARARRPVDDEDDDAAPPPRRARDEDDDAPRPKKKKKGKKKKQSGSPVLLFVLIGVGALVLIGGGIGVYFAFIKEDKPKETPVAKSDPPKGVPTRGVSPAVEAATNGWVDFTVAEARYQVKMPRQPGPPMTQRQPLPNGGTSEVKMYLVDLPSEAFITGFVLIPPAAAGAPPDVVLDNALNGAAGNAQGGQIKSRTSITYQGFPGREAVIELPGKKGAMVMRVVLAGDRMIMMLAGGDTATPDAPRVRGFLESLRIN